MITPFEFGEDSVNSDDMVTLMCTVGKGDFPIKINWYLNGLEVERYEGISTMRTNKRVSQLTIDQVQALHSGEYTCLASNDAGNASYSTSLRVNGTWY